MVPCLEFCCLVCIKGMHTRVYILATTVSQTEIWLIYIVFHEGKDTIRKNVPFLHSCILISHPSSWTVSVTVSFLLLSFHCYIQVCNFVSAYQFNSGVKRSSTSRWSWLPLQILFITVCIHTVQSVRQLYTPHTQLEAHTAGTAKHSQSV